MKKIRLNFRSLKLLSQICEDRKMKSKKSIETVKMTENEIF